MNYRSLLVLILVIHSSTCIGNIVIESTQPHNKNCYTQGLMFLNKTHLFQSCGLYGSSYYHVFQYQATPFQIRQSYSTGIPWKSGIFLQGSTLFKDYVYMLTWKEDKAFKLNSTNLQLVKQYNWNHEGWGLTSNQTHLFATDGSDRVYILNQNFQLLQTKQVKTSADYSQYNINEMEYVNGFIYANIYLESKIVKINTNNWKVVNQYDGKPLVNLQTGLSPGEVINGIAFDKESGKFLIAGKHWSKIYQVSFTDFQNKIIFFLMTLVLCLVIIAL